LASECEGRRQQVKDLNADPSLPYPDASFDAVTCAVSVDYLTRQPELMREVLYATATLPLCLTPLCIMRVL
jgi:hypothetical protein